MKRHSWVGALAAVLFVLGLAPLGASPAAAIPSPPDLEPLTVTATVAGIDDGSVVGTLTCSRPTTSDTFLDVELTQTRGDRTVSQDGSGYGPNPCGPEAVSFSLPLTRFNGVLAGRVHYRLDVKVFEFGYRDYATFEGDLRIRGRLDVAPPPPPDEGPLATSIDPRTSPGEPEQLLTGTVTCQSPADLDLSADGRQLAGHFYVAISGYQAVHCDGPTAFAIPLRSYNGPISSGRTLITLTARDSDADQNTTKTQPVRLRRQAVPPPYVVEPDPTSPLQIIAVHRTDTGFDVDITIEECTFPASVDVVLFGLPIDNRPGGNNPESRGYASPSCNGGPETVTVPVASDLRNRRLAVLAYSGSPGTPFVVNSGEFRVR